MTRSTAERWQLVVAGITICIGVAVLVKVVGGPDLLGEADTAAYGFILAAWLGPQFLKAQDAWERRFSLLGAVCGAALLVLGSSTW